MFIPPTAEALAALNAYISKNDSLKDKYPQGITRDNKHPNGGPVKRGDVKNKPGLILSRTTMNKIASDKRCKAAGIYVHEQRSWDRLIVHPGWMHAVTNVAPCIKFAYDFIPSCDILTAAFSQHVLASGYFAARMAMDYTALATVVGRELFQLLVSAKITVEKNLRRLKREHQVAETAFKNYSRELENDLAC